jgi:hypothetical protein
MLYLKKLKMSNEKFYKDLVAYNNPRFNYEKLNEELAELLHVTTKKLTKKPEHQPPINLLAEETAHVLIRIHALIKAEGISKLVGEEIKKKLDRLQGWMNEGRYKGGI